MTKNEGIMMRVNFRESVIRAINDMLDRHKMSDEFVELPAGSPFFDDCCAFADLRHDLFEYSHAFKVLNKYDLLDCD